VNSRLPTEIERAKYISVTTFRKNGIGVPTPLWFGYEGGRIYIMTRSDSGKFKRIRNNPHVTLAACTIRGRSTGPEYSATARVLPPDQWHHARQVMEPRYWLLRVPFLWSKKNVFLEIALDTPR
jgi:hypothetical protein